MATPMTDQQRKLDRKLKYIAGYIAGKEVYCRKHGIPFNEAPLLQALLDSELFDAHTTQGGPRPVVYRLDRNLGYVHGNIFVGTKADKHRIDAQHAMQRAAARKNPSLDTTQRPPRKLPAVDLAQYAIDYGQTRAQLERAPRTGRKPHPAPIGDPPPDWEFSNEPKKPPLSDEQRRKKSPRQQRWRERVRAQLATQKRDNEPPT